MCIVLYEWWKRVIYPVRRGLHEEGDGCFHWVWFEFERREGLYSTRLVAALTLPIELANAQPKLRGKNNNIFRIG